MKTFIYWTLALFTVLYFSSCEKDPGVSGDTAQILIIENGAQSIAPDESIIYTAALVDQNGNKTTASNVSWSSNSSAVASISADGQVTIASGGVTTIKASVTINNVTMIAEAPLNIMLPSIFVVAPSAILVDAEFPDIPLESVYLGTGNPTYNYQSSNNNVATVSSTGNVNFVGAGSCEITVTANGLDGTPVVIVPVVVLGTQTIELPVSRIVVSPSSYTMLKTESTQYTAKAYNFDNQIVNETINWSIEDPSIASVDNSGNITPLAVGETYVLATSNGITGKSEVIVVPDKVIILDPSYVSKAVGQSQQFTAKQYQVVRSGNELVLGSMTTPSNLNWEIPTYGFPIFDVATIGNNGLATIKSNATPGLSTFVMATDPTDPEIQPGVSLLSVAIGSGGSGCNCGTQNAAATSLNLISSSTVTLSFGGVSQIQAEVVDAFGNVVNGAAIVYCSDNIQVADVDFNGEIAATGFGTGTAEITVCHGNLTETITVNLQ